MRRKSMLAALASVVIAWGTPALADPASDAVADQSRSGADWALDEGRNPVEVLRFSGPKGGGVIADFMAGDGYYSALLAEIVGPRQGALSMRSILLHSTTRKSGKRELTGIAISGQSELAIAPWFWRPIVST